MGVFFRGLRKLVRRRAARVAQAGTIVITDTAGERRILLVTSRSGARWIFPKGRVEREETAEEAALREAEEEAGVRGDLAAYVGAAFYKAAGRDVRVDYFLLRATELVKPKDCRERRWCTINEALALLGSGELNELLSRAWPQIREIE